MTVVDGEKIGGVDRNHRAAAVVPTDLDRLRHEEWALRDRAQRGVEVALGEILRLARGSVARRCRIKPVGTGKGAEEVIKRFVLVEDHEDILDVLLQQGDFLRERQVRGRCRRCRCYGHRGIAADGQHADGGQSSFHPYTSGHRDTLP